MFLKTPTEFNLLNFQQIDFKDDDLHYKEIYQAAKLEVERLASVTSIQLLTN